MPELLSPPTRENAALPRMYEYVRHEEHGVGKIVPVAPDENLDLDMDDDGNIIVKVEWVEGDWHYAFWNNLTPFDPS